MVQRWREHFGNSKLWFGFVQIAGWQYGHAWGSSSQAGDLRQAQLAAIALGNVGLSTAIDTGDWSNIHPPDKQTPSTRLANQALQQIYGFARDADFPVYSGSSVATSVDDLSGSSTVVVTVKITAGGKPVQLSTAAPISATQSSTLGVGGSVARNMCVDSSGSGWSTYLKNVSGWQYVDGFLPKGNDAAPPSNATLAQAKAACAALADCKAITFHDLASTAPTTPAKMYYKNNTHVMRAQTGAADCGYPAIIGLNGTGARVSLNATASVGVDGSSLVLHATNAPAGFKAYASSYGRGSWPMTLFFAKEGNRLPVIPFFANFTTVNYWTPPSWTEP